MARDTDLASVRHQASILAEQVVCLVDVISRRTGSGENAQAKTDVLEHLLSKLHARQDRLNRLPH